MQRAPRLDDLALVRRTVVREEHEGRAAAYSDDLVEHVCHVGTVCGDCGECDARGEREPGGHFTQQLGLYVAAIGIAAEVRRVHRPERDTQADRRGRACLALMQCTRGSWGVMLKARARWTQDSKSVVRGARLWTHAATAGCNGLSET